MMEKRKLGTSDIEISVIGYGAWGIGGYPFWSVKDESASIKAIEKAAEMGVTFFDTAPVYGFGRSEELIGKALQTRRHEVVIATKCGLSWKSENFKSIFRDSSAGRIHQEVDASLKRLKTDYIDLFQVHWPDLETPVEETMKALEKIKSKGKIRAIGVSNFSVEQISEALRHARVDSSQPKYNMLDRAIEKDLVPFCIENRVSIVCYSPLDSGVLTGKYDEHTVFKDWRSFTEDFKGEIYQEKIRKVKALKSIAHKTRLTLAQMAIQWAAIQKGVTSAIAGANTEDQASENALSFTQELTSGILKEIALVLDPPVEG